MAIVRDWEYATSIDTEDCTSCIGNSAERKEDGTFLTSEEWCIKYNTCAATIDWEKVYGNSL